jgi:hypothetical protein
VIRRVRVGVDSGHDHGDGKVESIDIVRSSLLFFF